MQEARSVWVIYWPAEPERVSPYFQSEEDATEYGVLTKQLFKVIEKDVS